MNKSILLVSLILAACGGGSEGDALTDAQAVTKSNTRVNAASYANGQAFTVQGDAYVSATCLQGSGVGVATLADGTILECPTYARGNCMPVAVARSLSCNTHLHYPFPQL